MSEFLPDAVPPQDTGYLKKVESLAGKLDEKERAQWIRFNASVSEITPEFKAWLTNFILVEVAQQIPASQLQGGEQASVACRLTRTVDQAGFSGGVAANVVWQLADFDPSGMWDGSTKVTIKTPGKYIATLEIEYQTDNGQTEIWKNNTTRESIWPNASTGRCFCLLNLVAGDYLHAKVNPASSATIVNFEANHTPQFAVVRVSS